MRLRQYLKENIVMNDDFIKNVEDFVFKNDKKYLLSIAKNKNKIPAMFKNPNVLYRGMILDKKIFDVLNNKENFKLEDYSSWTLDKNMAVSFVNDKTKKISNKKGVKVIFKKRMSKEIILDVFSYIMYLEMVGKLDEVGFDETTKDSALKEKEFICDKNIVLKYKDIDKIIK